MRLEARFKRRVRRSGSLFFWRDRTREVDFLTDAGGRLELFEARWTELRPSPTRSIRITCENSVGADRILGCGVVSRARNSFPLTDDVRALAVGDIR